MKKGYIFVYKPPWLVAATKRENPPLPFFSGGGMEGFSYKCSPWLSLCRFFIAFAILWNSCNAWGKVYLDIDSPAFQQFAIAVPDFKAPSGGKREQPGDPAAWFSDTLTDFLRMTGFFNVIDKKAYLEDQDRKDAAPENIRFSDWMAIGAEYLVKGSVQHVGNELNMECGLYDVVKGALILGRKYTGKDEDRKKIIRKFAGEVLLALTGEGGVFATRIAFVMKKGKTSDIYTIGFDGKDLVKVTKSNTIHISPRWSPDGRYLSFTSYEEGSPAFYVKDLLNLNTEKISDFQGINLPGGWSPDGKKILLTLSKDGNEEIYVLDFINRRLLKRLTNDFAIDVSPVWSPDGGKIAFVSNRAGSPQIYLMNADGSNVRRLTFEGNYNTSPIWSPKGDRIAYEGMIEGRFRIFLMGADGANNQQLTFGAADDESPSWSPDGRYIAFSRNKNGKKKIYIMNANGTNIRVLYEGGGDCSGPSWSPIAGSE
jgi:TolB protein